VNTAPAFGRAPACPSAARPVVREFPPVTQRQAGQPLPVPLRRALEHLSGLEMADVRVHRGSALPARLGARAFAFGTHVHLGPGADGALAHEAWHVVQQKQGRVAATARVNGLPLNDDAALEAEAEAMGSEARRLAHEPPLAESRPPMVGRARVVRPVVQRWVHFTHDNSQYLGGQGLVDKLDNEYDMSNDAALPHAQREPLLRVCGDVVRLNTTFADLEAARLEVKRRAFRKAHVDGMRSLWLSQEQAKRTMEIAEVRKMAKSYKGSNPSALGNLYQRYGEPRCVFWTTKVDFRQVQTLGNDSRDKEMFRWVSGDANFNREPRLMNCWEAVLFAGAAARSGHAGVYDGRYGYWAMRTVGTPCSTNGAVGGTHRLAAYVPAVVQGAFYHAARTDANAVNGRPRMPATVPEGAVVVFASGAHVALATGKRRKNTEAGAIARYGRMGNEIFEVDQTTEGVALCTIEDHLGEAAGTYANEIHLGWMPEKDAAQTFTMNRLNSQVQICQVNVPQTHFYD
jgi:hypothetical protein